MKKTRTIIAITLIAMLGVFVVADTAYAGGKHRGGNRGGSHSSGDSYTPPQGYTNPGSFTSSNFTAPSSYTASESFTGSDAFTGPGSFTSGSYASSGSYSGGSSYSSSGFSSSGFTGMISPTSPYPGQYIPENMTQGDKYSYNSYQYKDKYTGTYGSHYYK